MYPYRALSHKGLHAFFAYPVYIEIGALEGMSVLWTGVHAPLWLIEYVPSKDKTWILVLTPDQPQQVDSAICHVKYMACKCTEELKQAHPKGRARHQGKCAQSEQRIVHERPVCLVLVDIIVFIAIGT